MALDSRALIERAKGVLMERERLDDQEAFIHLRRAARSSGRKLSEVAGEIAAGLPLPKGRARAADTPTEQAEGAAETTQPDAWNATRSPGDKSGTVRLIDWRFGR